MTGGLFIGLISGTSMDGVDAALLRIDPDTTPELIATRGHGFTDRLREDLAAAIARPEQLGAVELARLDMRLGLAFAEAASALMDQAGVSPEAIRAIGSHGQTVYHDADGEPPVTLQAGNPAVIAERTGVEVIAEFRQADLAAGGQAAPLAPALHAALFRSPEEDRAVVNLGGIANLTLLPADPAAPVTGFDTGPGNCLMDEWIARHCDQRFDADGEWAASGRVIPALLERLLEDPFFQAPPPKSTGRESFHAGWLAGRLNGDEAPEDVQATLCELTAVTVARGLESGGVSRVLVCGGGAHNGQLLRRLAAHVGPAEIGETSAFGLPADWVEAVLFGWLAHRHLAGLPGNLPTVTGARGERVLGARFPPP